MTGDHDGKCEAEWESGAKAYTACGCAHRRATGWEAVKSHVDSIAPPIVRTPRKRPRWMRPWGKR